MKAYLPPQALVPLGGLLLPGSGSCHHRGEDTASCKGTGSTISIPIDLIN